MTGFAFPMNREVELRMDRRDTFEASHPALQHGRHIVGLDAQSRVGQASSLSGCIGKLEARPTVLARQPAAPVLSGKAGFS